MMKYRGYYIDHVVFRTKSDIDAFVKDQAIKHYKTLCKMSSKNPSMELCAMMRPVAHNLHDEFGLSYDEIEAIEIEAIKTA